MTSWISPFNRTDYNLRRDLYATTPNQKWVTDMTKFKVPGEKKKCYLSVVLDLYATAVS